MNVILRCCFLSSDLTSTIVGFYIYNFTQLEKWYISFSLKYGDWLIIESSSILNNKNYIIKIAESEYQYYCATCIEDNVLL